jgi:hypothetical protein
MHQLMMKATEMGKILEIVSSALAQSSNMVHMQIPIRVASFTTLIHIGASPLSSTKKRML